MRIVLATNEPWGTYHAEPLMPAATSRGIDLVQWCPDHAGVPASATVPVITDETALACADLVVITGYASAHTRRAATLAACAGVPLGMTELAYLSAQPPPVLYPLTHAIATSPASAPSVAICAGVTPDDVAVLGWPALDHLPLRAPQPRRAVALTTVSGEDGGAHAHLDRALDLLDADSWDVTVRMHPREDVSHWADRWPVDAEMSLADAIAGAELVIGAIGTSAYYAAALGVPMIGIYVDGVPDALRSAALPLGEDVCVQARVVAPLRSAHRDWICGPIGGASDRIIDAWIASAR